MEIKAAILVKQNSPLVIDTISLRNPLSYGQVLVKVIYSGICGSQIDEITGANGPDRYIPHLLGHEGVGTVLETGEGVTTVKQDDVVVMHAVPSDGLQSATPKYYLGEKQINAGWVTTFNEFAVVSENRLVAIPKDFDLKLAPLFGCAVTTAMGVVNNEAKLRSGQSIVVYGCGSTGLCVVQSAKMVSAYPIVAIDLKDEKLEMAKQFGATHTINSSNFDNLTKAIYEIVGNEGANIVVNTTKNPKVIEEAYEITSDDGKTILIGLPTKGEKISYELNKDFQKVLIGTYGGGARPEIEIPQLVRLYNAGFMKLEGMITREFALEDINNAIEWTRKVGAGKCLIQIN